MPEKIEDLSPDDEPSMDVWGIGEMGNDEPEQLPSDPATDEDGEIAIVCSEDHAKLAGAGFFDGVCQSSLPLELLPSRQKVLGSVSTYREWINSLRS